MYLKLGALPGSCPPSSMPQHCRAARPSCRPLPVHIPSSPPPPPEGDGGAQDALHAAHGVLKEGEVLVHAHAGQLVRAGGAHSLRHHLQREQGGRLLAWAPWWGCMISGPSPLDAHRGIGRSVEHAEWLCSADGRSQAGCCTLRGGPTPGISFSHRPAAQSWAGAPPPSGSTPPAPSRCAAGRQAGTQGASGVAGA